VVLIGVFIFVARLVKFSDSKIIPLTVIEDPVIAPAKPVAKPQETPKPVETRKVFGASRKSITAVDTDKSAIAVKQGNTVAKEQDDLKLNESDADTIPIPADDYLITQGVKLIYSPKLTRTEEAQKEGYTATAQVSLIVDDKGLVRDVQLLNELKFGLGERAVEIARQMKFEPAQVQGNPVAVKIRYIIRFISSN
jgi:TonB family protein